MNKLVFIIGASGSGKTTAVKALEKPNIFNCQILYFDNIGVPSFEEMKMKYNSPEEWQRIKTEEWVKTIKQLFLSKTHVILDGQTRPIFIEQACIKYEILAYEVILFDCSDEERTKRLVHRGNPELADQNMMNWAKYLREESQKRDYHIINNTHLTHKETFNQLQDLISTVLFS